MPVKHGKQRVPPCQTQASCGFRDTGGITNVLSHRSFEFLRFFVSSLLLKENICLCLKSFCNLQDWFYAGAGGRAGGVPVKK